MCSMTEAEVEDAYLNLKLLHCLQDNTGMQHRHWVGGALTNIVNALVPPAGSPAPDKDPLIAALYEEGCAGLGQVLTKAQAEDVTRYFERTPCFNSHVSWSSDNVPRFIGRGAESFHYASYRLTDILAAPHLIELANRPDILGIAEAYLGCTPTLYSLNAWWSFSGHGKAEYSQSFHRDLDDYRFCTLFCFLTDVGQRNGAHVYMRRSHRADLVERLLADRGAIARQKFGRPIGGQDIYIPPAGYGKDELYEVIFAGLKQTFTGPAGFGFMADTGGLHMGEPLTEGRRLMFWARYGLYKNPMAGREPAVPRDVVGDRIGRDPRSKFINRCILG